MIVKNNSTPAEQRNIDLLNKVFNDVPLTQQEVNILSWLSAYEPSTVKAVISAFEKARQVRSGDLFPLGHTKEGYEKQYYKELYNNGIE